MTRSARRKVLWASPPVPRPPRPLSCGANCRLPPWRRTDCRPRCPQALPASDPCRNGIRPPKAQETQAQLLRACLNNIHVCDGAMWDAVLGASLKQYREYCKDCDNEMRPARGRFAPAGRLPAHGHATAKAVAGCPVPSGCGQTGGCVVPSLANIRDIGCAPLLTAIPFWPQRIARILLRQALVFIPNPLPARAAVMSVETLRGAIVPPCGRRPACLPEAQAALTPCYARNDLLHHRAERRHRTQS